MFLRLYLPPPFDSSITEMRQEEQQRQDTEYYEWFLDELKPGSNARGLIVCYMHTEHLAEYVCFINVL